MKRKYKDRQHKGNPILKILLLAILMLGAAYRFSTVAQTHVRQSLNSLYGQDARITFDWVIPGLDGKLSAEGLEIYDEKAALALRADQVVVTSPGWPWLLSALFHSTAAIDAPEYWRIDLLGVEEFQDAKMPKLAKVFGIGKHSAAAFEAAGCEREAWEKTDLTAMGLSPGPMRRSFEFHSEPGRFYVQHEVETPNVSGFSMSRNVRVGQPVHVLNGLTLPDGSTIEAEEYQQTDLGFNAARNQYCAKRAQSTEEEFMQRHLAAVDAILAGKGIGVSPEAKALYQQFALEGGSISLAGNYQTALPYEQFSQMPFEELLTRLAAKIAHNDHSEWVAWQHVPFSSLAQTGDAPPIAIDDAAQTEPAPQDASANAPTASPTTQQQDKFSPIEVLTSKPPERVAFDELPKFLGKLLVVYVEGRTLRRARIEKADGAKVVVRVYVQGGTATYAIDRGKFLYAETIN